MMALLDPASALAVRVTTELIFTGAAVGKLRAPAAFRETLGAYGMLPRGAVPMVARALPLAEVAIAIALPMTVLGPYPAVAAGGLLALFAGAMAANLLRGRAQIACGCGFSGRGADRLRWVFVARNLVLAALLLVGAGAVARFSVQAAVSGVLGGVALFLVIEAANTLALLPTPAAARSL